MVYSANTIMIMKNIHQWHWPRVAQTFIGLFFIGAGLFKLQNYFLVGDQSLPRPFQFWIDNAWPPLWSLPLFHWGQSHHLFLSALVIALQIIPGILLVLHWHTRIAATVLFFMQMGIFIGTFHHLGFNEFVGTSLWIALFYLLKPQKNLWSWPLLTYLFVGLALLQLYNRFVVGDPWLSTVTWQREHLAADVMSIHPLWKNFILAIAHMRWGTYLWAASWWIQLACVLGLLTRFRLSFSAILICLWFLHIWTWMNGITSQGVLWLLATFVWMTEEYQQQNMNKSTACHGEPVEPDTRGHPST